MSKYDTGRYIAVTEDGRVAVRASRPAEVFAILRERGLPVSSLQVERDVNADHVRGDIVEWYDLSEAAYSALDVFADEKIPAKVHGNTMNSLYDKGLVTTPRSRFARLTRAGWLLSAAYMDAEGHDDLANEYRRKAVFAVEILAPEL